MEYLQLKITKNHNGIYKIIGNDSVISTLPWGGIAIVCSGGTADDVPKSVGSVIWPDTSAGPACGGEGTSCVWGSDWGGEGATWIGDAGRGGEDGAIFYRFGWVLVLFGPFLLCGAWLGWGHLHSMFESSWPLSMHQSVVTKTKFHEWDIRKGIGGVLLKFGANRVTDDVPVATDVPWKDNVSIEWNWCDKEDWEFTLKACARVVAATDGETFDRLVVVFLKRMFRCVRAARLGALWLIKEIGPDWRSSIGLPLLLTVGAGSSTWWDGKKWVANKVRTSKGT